MKSEDLRQQETGNSEPGSGVCYTPASMTAVIKTLIFDLDDTLRVEEASAEAAFIETGALARLLKSYFEIRRIAPELYAVNSGAYIG